MFHLIVLLVCVVTLHDVSCSEECSSIATFNAGFLHNVKVNYEQNIADVSRDLLALDADVICLQEVWLESDMSRLLARLQRKYPHHYSKIHYRQGDIRKPSSEMSFWESFGHTFAVHSPCSLKDIARLFAELLPCAISQGCLQEFQISNERGLKCLTGKCEPQVRRVQTDCLTCIPLMVGGLEEVMEACAPDLKERFNRLNGPGLVLLSKTPMSNVQYEDFFRGKQLVLQRGFLQAEIENMGQVVCTHLSSPFEDYWEFDMDALSSFLEQQREEIQILLQKFGSTDHLLVGDLNTGPARLDFTDKQKNLTEEGKGNFQILEDAGYSTTYIEQDGRCTYCSHNPLSTESTEKLIDFVLTKGLQLGDSTRVMDRVEPRPLSDHFGMQAEVCPES